VLLLPQQFVITYPANKRLAFHERTVTTSKEWQADYSNKSLQRRSSHVAVLNRPEIARWQGDSRKFDSASDKTWRCHANNCNEIHEFYSDIA
jgi:hypothetical protein